MSREKPVAGFDYTSGQPVERTPSQWRRYFVTHTRRVEHGETFFINPKTKRTEHEAYSVIAVK